jgi:gamma-glutamyltranspeptidase/glutathione hydrolase
MIRTTIFVLLMVIWAGGLLAQGRDQVARSESGMVVAAHPLASVAGLRILEQGGNAADAAVAAGFAVSVVRPSMNSIGGRNQILIRNADGEVFGIDGTTQVPEGYDISTAPRASYGYATVGVPGALAGLMRLHSEHGTLPLETLMAPAIEYAENGFRLLSGQALFHRMTAEQLAETEGARTAYLKPDLSPYRAGDLLRQPVLARTLRSISQGGADAFYQGEIAAAMAADMAANGGFLTLRSLNDYRAEDSRIVRGSYRGYELVALDIPASGAIAIQALHIMENFSRAEFSTEEWAVIVAHSIGLAVPDLGRLGSDSAAIRATSKEWAESQAEHIQIGAAVGSGAAPSSQTVQLHEDNPSYTTHLSVADSAGMVVSFTQTIGPAMGSRVVTPGLGFLYAVTLGGYLSGEMQPGERARSGITPLLVLRDGEPVLVLGAAGGLRIISAVVQAVTRVVDDEMSFAEALAAPRVHPEFDSTFTFSGMSMQTSGPMGWTERQIEEIRAMGFDVSPSGRVGGFGRVHGIRFLPEMGLWEGVADPGGEGTALGRAAQRRR